MPHNRMVHCGNSYQTASPVQYLASMFHFGVSGEAPYHKDWLDRRVSGDCFPGQVAARPNTRVMIYEALNRFLKHIPPYCDVIVVLHSALWDVLRYQEHFKRNQDEDAWIAEYQHNLTSYLEGLQTILERHYGSSSRRIMRSVVVKTTPLVDNRDIARPLHKLNQLKRGMAHEYKIFDAALDFKK
eukprot:gene28114-34788_t